MHDHLKIVQEDFWMVETPRHQSQPEAGSTRKSIRIRAFIEHINSAEGSCDHGGLWPWRVSDDATNLPPLDLEHIGDNKIIEELNTYSDRELDDLGISRGAIPEAILFGREGIEREEERKVA
jgi:hypothetical protein